jgi:hypothetical protein
MKTKTPTKPTTKKKPPAVTCKNNQVTINAEFVDDLFAETIRNLMALQVVWEKVSLKEELRHDA